MVSRKVLGGLRILVILIVVIFGAYFLFFHVSESKAREIVREDYNKDTSDICNKFLVGDTYCGEFSVCYINRAIIALPDNLLVPFAKDVKAGKSSAFDSYSLINGKQIGENCVSEILEIPENVDVNIIANEPIDQGSDEDGRSTTDISCIDSDGGRDYGTKGIISISTTVGPIEKTDYCTSTQPSVGDCTPTEEHDCVIIEYYCGTEPVLNFERYICSGGCVDGACI
jgi:hypothetical protein